MTKRISFADYRTIPAVNASALWQIHSESPFAYRWHRDHPGKSDTPAKVFGSAGHAAILEPEKFVNDYTVYPSPKRGEHWLQFKEQNDGRIILGKTDHDRVTAVRDSVRRHAFASKLLTNGDPEVTIEWTHKRTGTACKSRIDWLGAEGIVDLKNTRNLAPGRFATDFARYGYHVKAAFYADACAAMGVLLPYWIIAVDSKPPHDVVCYEVPPDVLSSGQEIYEQALDTYIECTRTGIWPGISAEPLTINLPAWAQPESEEALTFDGAELNL